ncbi:MAG: phytanoyl-CoA dioxygenase family protein [Sulfurovum sp.]|nr:phytanoyl-CoA dioxygenase family protein [Sulfurovum sp.]
MQLSAAQITQFHRDGFLILRDFLEAEKCDAISTLAKKHLEDKVEPLETELAYNAQSKEARTQERDYESKTEKSEKVVRRLRQVYDRDILFKNWMENEKLRPVLQQLLEDQVVLTTAHHNSIMTKLAGVSTATAWHQDRRYWRYSDDNLISVWLALDEETSHNGSLEFIPKSHTMTFKTEDFNEKEYLCEKNSKNQSLMSHKVSTKLHKGDVVIFHSLLLHRANKNASQKDKISFVYTVKGAKTKALEGSRSSEFEEFKLTLL